MRFYLLDLTSLVQILLMVNFFSHSLQLGLNITDNRSIPYVICPWFNKKYSSMENDENCHCHHQHYRHCHHFNHHYILIMNIIVIIVMNIIIIFVIILILAIIISNTLNTLWPLICLTLNNTPWKLTIMTIEIRWPLIQLSPNTLI